MKKRMKIIGAALLLLVMIACLSACANWKTPYELLEKDGYRVSVKFDANGGSFAGSPYEVFVVDVFNPDDAKTGANGKKEIPLIKPDDPARKDTAFEVSRDGYDLAGWYRERSPRVNEAGEPLDDYGELCSVSGREQGYVYAGKWDFEKDRLEVDPNAELSADENLLTLYAAWIPYTTFEFYDSDTEKLLGTYKGLNVTVPVWDEKTGKLDMDKFPKPEGKTFEAAYMMVDGVKVQVSGEISCGFDEEKGIVTATSVKIYTDWIEGEWFHIYTAKQFRDNFKVDGNYVICADLDFSKTTWRPEISQKTFNGVIEGNGFRFANVTVKQTNAEQKAGGLFGALAETAVIKDVVFENITYQLNTGAPRVPGASFGILAGEAHDAATLENLRVSGVLEIGAECMLHNDHNLGLLFGVGNNRDIGLSELSCQVAAGSAYKADVDQATGVITLSK